jgi:hypothetical protein
MAKRSLQLHEDLRREEEAHGSSDRSFGLVFAGFCALIAALGWWKGRSLAPYWTGAAVAFATVALARPSLLAPLNCAWTRLGLLLFHVVNPVVMFLLYALAIVPGGVVMRLLGKDPLRLRFESEAPSYWIPREPPGPAPETMIDQF